MKKFTIILLSLSLFICSCEEDKPKEKIYLEGEYSLDYLKEEKVSFLNSDHVFYLSNPNDTITLITITTADTIYKEENFYENGVDGVEGTAILRNDLTALLEGSLYANVSALCNPLVILSTFASAGVWSVNEENNTFQLNLEFDALDISGSFTFDEGSKRLTINYTTENPMDSIKISQIDHNGHTWDINDACAPVTSITEREMSLLLVD